MIFLALNPVTIKAALTAISIARKEENRRAILYFILTPIMILLLISAFAVYILTSPLSFFASFIFGDELDMIENFQITHGFSQGLGIYEADYLLGSGMSYEGIVFSDGAVEVMYYSQVDVRWANSAYGTDQIGTHGCGPTTMAMVISTLTSEIVDPVAMSQWSYANGGFAAGQGSNHSLIPNAATAWGLPVQGVSKTDNPQLIVNALTSGQLVVAIMGPGNFTTSGHFIVLRGITSHGNILVADPASQTRSNQEWDLSLIINESRNGAAAGGPFWIIGSPVTTTTPTDTVDSAL